MDKNLPIRVKAMCLFLNEGRVLVANGNTLRSRSEECMAVPGNFYRAIGGTIDFSETSEQGVRREIREELGSEIENLELLDVVESIFEYEGQQNHEIAFLYKGKLTNEDILHVERLHIVEDTYEFDAEWVAIEQILNGDTPLYPAAPYERLLQ